MQASSNVACRELGFAEGFIQEEFIDRATMTQVHPPWVTGLGCTGDETGILDCPRSLFGDTGTCGRTLRLFCYSDSTSAISSFMADVYA